MELYLCQYFEHAIIYSELTIGNHEHVNYILQAYQLCFKKKLHLSVTTFVFQFLSYCSQSNLSTEHSPLSSLTSPLPCLLNFSFSAHLCVRHMLNFTRITFLPKINQSESLDTLIGGLTSNSIVSYSLMHCKMSLCFEKNTFQNNARICLVCHKTSLFKHKGYLMGTWSYKGLLFFIYFFFPCISLFNMFAKSFGKYYHLMILIYVKTLIMFISHHL